MASPFRRAGHRDAPRDRRFIVSPKLRRDSRTAPAGRRAPVRRVWISCRHDIRPPPRGARPASRGRRSRPGMIPVTSGIIGLNLPVNGIGSVSVPRGVASPRRSAAARTVVGIESDVATRSRRDLSKRLPRMGRQMKTRNSKSFVLRYGAVIGFRWCMAAATAVMAQHRRNRGRRSAETGCVVQTPAATMPLQKQAGSRRPPARHQAS